MSVIEAAPPVESRAREDHIDNLLGDRVAPTPEQVATVSAWAAQLNDALTGDWLPELWLGDGPAILSALSDLTDPNVAHGQCFEVSQVIEEWCQFAAAAVGMSVHEVTTVQGMSHAVGSLQAHYALAVTLNAGDAPVIVDLTHSQINAAAPWPYVAAPAEWIAAIHVPYLVA